jgi:IS30 family transposase
VERLSEREKQEIERLSALGWPNRLIGLQIGRHHRTVGTYLAVATTTGSGTGPVAIAAVVG